MLLGHADISTTRSTPTSRASGCACCTPRTIRAADAVELSSPIRSTDAPVPFAPPLARRRGARLATLAGCATLDTQQRQWIFQPPKQTGWAGAQAADGMVPVWIDFESKESGTPARLHGLWLANEDPAAPVLLYLHGARWDVTGSAVARPPHGRASASRCSRSTTAASGRAPTERRRAAVRSRAYEDAHAAWDWIARNHPQQRRYIFGHSLGSAIAVHLATEVPDASGLIVEGTFTSIPAVFQSMPWGWLPVTGLITQRFDAAQPHRPGRASPVLVVHGSDDRLIRPELGRALYERAREPKRFVLVEGGSHHNTNALGQAQYREALRELFGLTL